MNKSILVIDTPENCDKCRICARAEIDDYCAYLGVSNGEFIYPNGYAELAIGMSNCPLKPLPKYVKDKNTFAIENKYMNYQDGYNACIDEILGDEND